MPQNQSPEEFQEECESQRIALVDANQWIDACRIAALKEYVANKKRLTYEKADGCDHNQPKDKPLE